MGIVRQSQVSDAKPTEHTMNTETTPAAEVTTIEIMAAVVDYSSKGNMLNHWFRMVYRDGAWEYFAERKATAPTYGAASRNQKIKGTVRSGELVLKHNYKGGVTEIGLASTGWEGRKSWEDLQPCTFKASGRELVITMPDGSTVTAPNPRS